MLALVVVVIVCVVLAIWYELRNPAQYEYICSNCGSVRKSFIPPRSKRKNPCLACLHVQLIPTDSAQGGQIMGIYHGAASAERYFGRVPPAEIESGPGL